MPRPSLKTGRAYVRPQPPYKERDFTAAEWNRYVDDLGRAVSSWLHYLETGEKEVSRTVMRFVRFTTTQDPDAECLYRAECVTGCDHTSGSWTAPHEVDRWMSMHSAGTGHTGFRRVFTDYAVVTRGDPL